MEGLIKLASRIYEIDRTLKTLDKIIKNIDRKLTNVDTNTNKAVDKNEAIKLLREFVKGNAGYRELKKVFEYIMKHEKCQYCRTMIASALAEYSFNNIEKAKFIASELLKYIGGEDG